MLFYIYIFLGIALLSFGGDYLVKGSSSFAKKLKISPMIIGIVIIGLGTSVPEIFVASNAVINNAPDIALGSIIGSNIANILLVFSFALIIAKGPLLKIVSFGDMVIMFLITLLLVSILIIGTLKMPFSLLMVLLLLIYFYCSYRFFNTEMEIEEIVSNENLFKVGSKSTSLFFSIPMRSCKISFLTILSILEPPPLPNLRDILLAALFKKSVLHSLITADDFPPIFFLSCIS